MRSIAICFSGLALLAILLLSQVCPSGYTLVRLSSDGAGKPILSAVVSDGERIRLTWHNSLFRLDVTEVFFARGGILIQDQVTFSVPGGPPPPRVSARDVDDLYHTGGAFDARGLARPFSRIAYRIGEIGNPRIQVGGKTAVLREEAGFGGRVILVASRPSLHEVIFFR